MHELETDRFYLRQFRNTDLVPHHKIIGSDPQVTWHGKALTLEESKAALERRMRHWEEHGFGMWVVVEKASEAMLGHAGLQYLENTNEVELGYYLGRSAWGRGVATEAGAACLRYGFETLPLDQVVAVVRPENMGSQRVLSKLGLRRTQDAHHYGFDVQVWQIERAAFLPTQGFYHLVEQ